MQSQLKIHVDLIEKKQKFNQIIFQFYRPTIPSLFASNALWISVACFSIWSSLPLLILRKKLTVSALEIFPFGQAA
jgi:hypothetical protein